jgi:hypothetical protein
MDGPPFQAETGMPLWQRRWLRFDFQIIQLGTSLSEPPKGVEIESNP